MPAPVVRVTKRKGVVTINAYDCPNAAYAVTHVLMDSRVLKALALKECDIELTQEHTVRVRSLMSEPVAPAAKATKK